jgi:hypothetical protein
MASATVHAPEEADNCGDLETRFAAAIADSNGDRVEKKMKDNEGILLRPIDMAKISEKVKGW